MGELVHERSYAAITPGGEKEKWLQTVDRVIDGNLGLVNGKFIEPNEREELRQRLFEFEIIPGGRHLQMSGKKGRQFLFNCHVAGWHPKDVARHFVFTFDQLMQGGGVGANYSDRFLNHYPRIRTVPELHLVCSPEHPDYEELKPLLSETYSHEWDGSFRVPDSREGWCEGAESLIDAFWSPDDETLVMDLSLIRARGTKIRTFGGTSSGPAYFAKMLLLIHGVLAKRLGGKMLWSDAMEIDHHIASCVVSGNVRRSARMSMKWWSDPDIFDFIACKKVEGLHWSTNISVVVDDAFFRALREGNEKAIKIMRLVVEGMLTNGEPGFYNFTRASEGELGNVFCTNPCGEITLEEWENCNLGHVNLDAYCNPDTGEFNYKRCEESFRLVTRFLVRATFGDVPSKLQKEVMERNRRIGVGFTGFHSWLTKQGIRWSESHHDPYIRKTLRDFHKTVRKAADRYCFEMRIPACVKTTTLAPCGTISKLPGVSESLEAIKFRYFLQGIRYAADDHAATARYEGMGYKVEPTLYEANTNIVYVPCKNRLLDELEHIHGKEKAEWLLEEAAEIALDDMLAVQQMVQDEYADNAISFTANRWADEVQQAWIKENPDWSEKQLPLPLPAEHIVIETQAAIRHFLPRLKGTTLMVDGSRRQAPFTQITKEEYESYVNGNVAESSGEDCATGACEWAPAEDVRRELV